MYAAECLLLRAHSKGLGILIYTNRIYELTGLMAGHEGMIQAYRPCSCLVQTEVVDGRCAALFT